MKTHYREWTIYWGQYGNARFWSDVVPPSHKGHLYPLSHVGSFKTREEAVAKALELIDEGYGNKFDRDWYAQKAKELISLPIRCGSIKSWTTNKPTSAAGDDRTGETGTTTSGV